MELSVTGRVQASCYLETAGLVARAGGDPVLLPALEPVQEAVDRLLEHLHGVVLIGGDDIPAEDLGGPLHPQAEVMHPRRAAFDRCLIRGAFDRRLPMLGICLGAQQINVYRGGEHLQHLADLVGEQVGHRVGPRGHYERHLVRLRPGSLVERILGRGELLVASRHHQAAGRPGEGLVASAHAADGVVEALEDPDHPFLLGVQWHPEVMSEDATQLRLFEALVEAAREVMP